MKQLLTDIENWAQLLQNSADHNYEEFLRLAGHNEAAALEAEDAYDVESTQAWVLWCVAQHIKNRGMTEPVVPADICTHPERVVSGGYIVCKECGIYLPE
jgi:hypothetical protein